MLGAVDPYLDGEIHLIYFLDPEGESQFELEEAFVTSRMLPLRLEAQGLQVEFGQMFTEFGRINPQHPHAWDWQDQPVVLSRFFGPDGMRGVGTRVGWLLPVPWFSELHAGVQNAQGETANYALRGRLDFEPTALGDLSAAGVGWARSPSGASLSSFTANSGSNPNPRCTTTDLVPLTTNISDYREIGLSFRGADRKLYNTIWFWDN